MPTVRGAFDYLTENCLEIFGPCESMLYVGHRHDTHPWWHQTFAKLLGVKRLAVIDINKGNLDSAAHITKELYHGDIRTSPHVNNFDMVFWDEGPEHLPKDEAVAVCEVLSFLNTHVLISCPWGYQPQGTGPDDIEFHHWGPMPEDFETLEPRWTVKTFGTMFPGGHGNLIAWI